MKLFSNSFENGSRIPDKFCFCVPDFEGTIKMGLNINPHLAWSDAPETTKSFALICYDPDVPASGELVNDVNKVVPVEFPRFDFFHWVVSDIPANLNEIAEGIDSNGITPRGKKTGLNAIGNAGINDYTNWFANDESMSGFYGAYDGPCPPFNDERLHHYIFKVFALDVESVSLEGNYAGADLLKAIDGHVIDSAEITVTYTLNKKML